MSNIYNRYWRLNNMYKITDKQARSVVFKMNEAQKKFYRVEKEHKRIIVLKARQLGMTTYKCICGLDRCLFYSNQNIVITAHKQEKQKEIFQKVKYAFEQLPGVIKLNDGSKWGKPTPKYDSVNELYFPHNNSRIKVSLDSRSGTPTSLHITEIAFRKDAQQMMTGTLPSVPKGAPITIETTANGIGNYFYTLRKSSERTGSFHAFFLPRYEDSEYYSNEEYEGLPEELSDLESYNLTKKQKQRYKEKRDEIGRDVFQEYPTSPDVAFLSTGSPVFSPKTIRSLPELSYSIDSRFKGLRIYGQPVGMCYYGVDTAGGGLDGDYSAIIVRDANMNLLASYYDHMTPDGLCDIIDHLFYMGYIGTIGVERNNTGIATLLKAKEYHWHTYLYAEKTIDKITNKRTKKYGWNTTSASRPVMISDYEESVRKGNITQVDERQRSEMFGFYYNERNRPEAVQGNHDDAIMADAICLQMSKTNQGLQFINTPK